MLHSNVPLPYSIEYAKSGRSTCKKCKKVISANALRMSVNHPASFFDGNIDSWFHYECFWKNLIRGQDEINISSIRGVDWLRWEDQEDLRVRIKKFKEPHVHSPSPVFVNEVSLSDLKIEKSASNRGKCVKCNTNFEKGEMKVHKKGKFYHLKCHLDGFESIKGTLDNIPSWDEFDECWKVKSTAEFSEIMEAKKLANAQPENEPEVCSKQEAALDQEVLESRIANMCTENVLTNQPVSSSGNGRLVKTIEEVYPDDSQPSASTGKKRAASDDIIKIDDETKEEESEATRKRRLGKEARLAELQERRMKKQADMLFQNFELFNKMSSSDRIVVLRENNQDLPEGNDHGTQVVERLADYALFGCPIECLKCSNGKIVFNSSRRTYVCTGYATEYSKCMYETKNPVRTPFTMPKILYDKYDAKDVIFNFMSARLYREGEDAEEVVKTDKRKSRGGVHGDQFVYAAEQIDLAQSGVLANVASTATNTHIIKNGTLVDAKFQYANQSHVFKNEVDGSLYQASLSFTDLTLNKNSYYKIQLLKNDTTEQFYVFRSWGRVGTEVGDCCFEHCNKESGIARFEELFHEKTNNKWRYRAHFRKAAGFFSYVETDYSEIAELGKEDIIPGTRTRLPKPVKEVVMSIFDIENMKSALKSFEMDVNKMPLGRLSKNQINLAFGVLNEISDLLIEFPLNTTKILDASNKFYTIIPHSFGMRVPEAIDSFHKVKEKNNMLNALLEIKFAYDQICGNERPTAGLIGVDPVDMNYEKLKCAMTPLERNCMDWNIIHEYINNTQGSTHDMRVDLVDILKLSRDTESNKFKKHLGNRRLLWHGSGKMNFAGILGQGLRIAPPEAPASGYMFGKGVYFADMFSKSFFYCRANAKEEAYLLLCDVALGTTVSCMQATTFSKKTLPKNTHSVHGIGRECPHESGNYNHPDGYMIPRGAKHFQLQGVHNRDFFLLYNEFIVYDVDQVELKYLVRVKMHHARHRQ